MLAVISRLLRLCAWVVLLPPCLADFSADTFLSHAADNGRFMDMEFELRTITDRKEKRELEKRIKEERKLQEKILRGLDTLAKKAERKGINVQDRHGMTLLMYATQMSNAPALEYVMMQNPDLSLRDKNGRSALDYDKQGSGILESHLMNEMREAIGMQDFGRVRDCCKAGVDPVVDLDEGPLAGVLLRNNKADMFVELYRGKKMKDSPMADGVMLSELILTSGHTEVIKVGAAAIGSSFWKSEPGHISPLFHMVSRGQMEVLKIYAHQVGLQAEDVRLAVRHGSPEAVAWVLESKKDQLPEEVAFEAARRGNKQVLDAVMAAGASMTAKNARGETVLMHAALSGKDDVVKAVLEKQNDEQKGAVDAAGRSAIYYARCSGSKSVESLLQGAGISATPKDTVK